MNKLPLATQTKIIQLLVEGTSLRACTRITGVSLNTVTKLLVDVGTACQKFHDDIVTNVDTVRVECDEIWGFIYSKNKNAKKTNNPEAGDAWTWTAIDADSRLIVSWLVGKRDSDSACAFMQDLKSRLRSRVQLTTDGLTKYVNAVEQAFGPENIDYAQLEKKYGKKIDEYGDVVDHRIQYIGADRTSIFGNPDIKLTSTSYVERQNLTMRMHMRRFTRKTNGFSKKLDNHCHAVALHFVYYNFAKIHKTLRVTPAMQAGIMTRWMEIEDIVKLVDVYSN